MVFMSLLTSMSIEKSYLKYFLQNFGYKLASNFQKKGHNFETT